jgi:hypothetical protein
MSSHPIGNTQPLDEVALCMLMGRRRVVYIGSLLWAIIGSTIALASLPTVNEDARLLVGLASIVFPLCALAAGVALGRGHDRKAGMLLMVSAATPTYFAYPLNVPALVVGLAVLASPAAVLCRATR